MATANDKTINMLSLTDCLYFTNGFCTFKGKCRYRHCQAAVKQLEKCINWPNSCRNVDCPYRHSQAPTTISMPVSQGKALVVFYWDIENVPIPKGQKPFDIVQRIRQKFVVESRSQEVDFSCYCNIVTISQENQQSLHHANVRMNHVADRKPGAADRQIMLDLDRFERVHRPPATIVLISGDIDFIGKLSDLRHQARFHVVVIHNKPAKEELKATVNEHYPWELFTGPLLPQSQQQQQQPQTQRQKPPPQQQEQQQQEQPQPQPQTRRKKPPHQGEEQQQQTPHQREEEQQPPKPNQPVLRNHAERLARQSGSSRPVLNDGQNNDNKKSPKMSPKFDRPPLVPVVDSLGENNLQQNNTLSPNYPTPPPYSASKARKHRSSSRNRPLKPPNTPTVNQMLVSNVGTNPPPPTVATSIVAPRARLRLGSGSNQLNRQNILISGSSEQLSSVVNDATTKTEKKLLPCPHCTNEFSTINALRQHQKDKKHLFDCPTCKEGFVTSSGLSQHQRSKGHNISNDINVLVGTMDNMNMHEFANDTGHNLDMPNHIKTPSVYPSLMANCSVID